MGEYLPEVGPFGLEDYELVLILFLLAQLLLAISSEDHSLGGLHGLDTANT